MLYYENLQSLVSYASYKKAMCVDTVEGGTCCLPYCHNDTTPEHDGYELQGFEPVCPECEFVLTVFAPEELTQIPPNTPIYFNEEGQVVLDNDDDLPF